jgi:hypothetical protein
VGLGLVELYQIGNISTFFWPVILILGGVSLLSSALIK